MKEKAVCLLGVSALLAEGASFEAPILVKAGGEAIRTESPGYAAPCLADLDGDGSKELLVGQFRDGKIQVFGKSGASYAKGTWLMAKGEVAKIPGVW